MIGLCTGNPDGYAEGGQIVARFPSGDTHIEIAMTPHQAICLFKSVERVAVEALNEALTAPPAATVIAFPTKKVRRR